MCGSTRCYIAKDELQAQHFKLCFNLVSLVCQSFDLACLTHHSRDTAQSIICAYIPSPKRLAPLPMNSMCVQSDLPFSFSNIQGAKIGTLKVDWDKWKDEVSYTSHIIFSPSPSLSFSLSLTLSLSLSLLPSLIILHM